MAGKHGWSAGRVIARELDDLLFILRSRDEVTLHVDEGTSTLVFHTDGRDLWVPIRKGKIHEAQAVARAILREKSNH